MIKLNNYSKKYQMKISNIKMMEIFENEIKMDGICEVENANER